MGLKENYLRVKNYLKTKNDFSERRFLDFLIERIEKSDCLKPFFINAPTGYGKTVLTEAITLNEYESGYKAIVSYPLRSLIEDQKIKISEVIEYIGLGKIVGLRYMGKPDSPYLIYPITLTTVDTLALTALGLSPEDTQKVFRELMGTNYRSLGHYLFSLASVYTSTIILDEVHLLYDSSKSLSFLKALIILSKLFGNKLFFMSATLPRNFIQKLGGKSSLIYEEFTYESDPKFFEERKKKEYKVSLEQFNSENKLDKVYNLIKKSEFNRALVIFNTVEDAINFYKKIEGEKILIHSRFSVEDRTKKTLRLRSETKKQTIIIGTQAIEAGIDISSDLIISEIAPPISLIQRFGRFLRRNEMKGSAYIWYEEDLLNANEKHYKVYDKELTKRTIDFLASNSDINLHVGYEDFLNKIYLEEPTVDSKLINEIINVITNLTESSKSALELLLKMDGSFIRDGNIFIAVSENGIEVPVNYHFLKKRIKNGSIVSEKEAVIKSLLGEKFYVRGYYDNEIGLE